VGHPVFLPKSNSMNDTFDALSAKTLRLASDCTIPGNDSDGLEVTDVGEFIFSINQTKMLWFHFTVHSYDNLTKTLSEEMSPFGSQINVSCHISQVTSEQSKYEE
jgi:hypothetical protein